MAHRRALPGTVVPWSPDFPRASCEAPGRPALWPIQYGLLGTRQQQGEQFGSTFPVDDPVDKVGPEAPLKGDHRLLGIGYVIAEALERKQEPGIGPIGVDKVAGRTGKCEPALREGMP